MPPSCLSFARYISFLEGNKDNGISAYSNISRRLVADSVLRYRYFQYLEPRQCPLCRHIGTSNGYIDINRNREVQKRDYGARTGRICSLTIPHAWNGCFEMSVADWLYT
jgi:hypothetical protein